MIPAAAIQVASPVAPGPARHRTRRSDTSGGDRLRNDEAWAKGSATGDGGAMEVVDGPSDGE